MEASKALLDSKIMKELFMGDRLIHTKIHDAPPVKYLDNAKVKDALVGTGSIINGTIENSVIFRNVIIEEGAKVKNSVILPLCHVGKKAILENVICEKDVVIEDGEVHKGTANKPVILSND